MIKDPVCGMEVSEDSEFQSQFHHQTYYFCSEHCIKKYEEQHNITEEKKYCPSCAVKGGTPWYKEKLFIITILIPK